MAFSINGFGTTFYGQAAFEPDGSFITTKWIILFYVPVIPTGSLRVRYASRDSGFFSSGTQFDVIMDYPIDIAQVLRTWIYVFCLFGALSLFSKVSEGAADAEWRLGLLGAVIMLPHVLRWFARRSATSAPAGAPRKHKTGTLPAPRTRLEDLPKVSTCPKCRYTRKAEDYAPAWQCPSCKVAYNKVS